MAQTSGDTVRATNTSFDIVEALRSLESAGVTELADRLDLPKSTVYNHLLTLTERGYVMKEERRYRLSLRFLSLGETTRRRQQLFEVGKSEVDDLAAQTGANAYIVAEENGYGVILYRKKENAINLGDHVGTRMHLTSTAAGKAILAELPEERIDDIVDSHGLPAMTDNTITDRATLDEELAAVRERGYAFVRGEQVPGLRAISVVLNGPEGDIHGGLSIAGPKQLMRGDDFERELPELLLSAANVIELKLLDSVTPG